MGNLQSALCRDSQDTLNAAICGDVAWVKRQIVEEPKLVFSSVTLVKRRGVLHLAAKQGHSDVISTVLQPLIEAVRQEFDAQQQYQQQPAGGDQHKQQHLSCQQQQDEPKQQQDESRQQLEQPERHTVAAPAVEDAQQAQQQHQQHVQQQVQPHQPLEQQLVSFRRLRQMVNARDFYRRTALIVAAKQGHLRCTQLLVEGATNLFAVDREGNTCLHYAALHGHREVAEYLLQKAHDRNVASRFANKRNLSGFTPLHYAVWSCSESLVLALLQADADVAAANNRVFDAWLTVPVGSTPLHLAVARNHMPIALMLLQHYAVQLTDGPADVPRPQDPRTIPDLYGMNPAQLAAHRGHRHLSRVLVPTLSLARVLEALQPDAPRVYGPPSLKAIAAGAMQVKLTQELEHLNVALTARLQAAQLHDAAGCPLISTETPAQAFAPAEASAVGAAGSAGACGLPCSGCSPCCSQHAATICSGDADEPVRAGATNSATCCSPASSSALQCIGPAAVAAAAGDVQACSGAAGCSGLSRQASSSGWPDDEQCCVCWEADVSVAVGPCMHALCLACAQQLVASSGRTGSTCPLCRSCISAFSLLPELRQTRSMTFVSPADSDTKVKVACA